MVNKFKYGVFCTNREQRQVIINLFKQTGAIITVTFPEPKLLSLEYQILFVDDANGISSCKPEELEKVSHRIQIPFKDLYKLFFKDSISFLIKDTHEENYRITITSDVVCLDSVAFLHETFDKIVKAYQDFKK